MRAGSLIAAAVAVALLAAGCGGTSAAAPEVVTGASASCAATTPAQNVARARLVVLAEALPGPTVNLGTHKVLTSPVRMRVVRYVKGHGPTIVSVRTALTKTASGVAESEDAIQPIAGQLWKLYLTGRHPPYQTSICGGSRQIRGPHRK
jgi:hypothetical protein